MVDLKTPASEPVEWHAKVVAFPQAPAGDPVLTLDVRLDMLRSFCIVTAQSWHEARELASIQLSAEPWQVECELAGVAA